MEARDYLKVLNGRIAAITAIILFNLGSAGVLGGYNGNTLYCNQDTPREIVLMCIMW